MSPTIDPTTAMIGVKIDPSMAEYSELLGLPFVNPDELDDEQFEQRQQQVRTELFNREFDKWSLTAVDGLELAAFEDCDQICLVLGVQLYVDYGTVQLGALAQAQDFLRQKRDESTDPVVRDILNTYIPELHLIPTNTLLSQ